MQSWPVICFTVAEMTVIKRASIFGKSLEYVTDMKSAGRTGTEMLRAEIS